MAELYADKEETKDTQQVATIKPGEVISSPKIYGGELNGTYFTTGGNVKERFDLFPSYDKTISFIQYNQVGEVTLKGILSGDNAGDIILGNYSGGKGALWDNSEGKFYVNGALLTGADSVINGTYIDSLTVSKLTSGTITAQAITLASSTASCYINSGKTAFNNTQAGFILGVDHTDSKAKFYIGDTSNYLNWDGSALSISGSVTATTGTIGGFTIGATSLLAGTGATRIQLDTSSGIHLGANLFADAPFSVSLAGELKSISGTIANWTISNTALSTGAYDTLSTMYFGTSGISLSNVFKVSSAGVLTATSGSIAGWEMQSDLLRSASSGARIELNKTKSRVSVFDATSEKVVMGYLNGLAKNDGTGNWGAGDYGFWAAAGDMLSIDGDGEYTSGDWIVRNDAAYLINDASNNTIVRLGTDSGEKGLFIYDTSGNQLAKYVSDEVFVGEATKYLKYTSAGGLEVMGDIVATSGKFGTTTNYWSVGATGLTAVSSSTDVIINYGKTDFGQDSTAGFILGYDYSATASKFEIGSSAGKIFKYDGTDFSLTGGTITGGIIQTATSGKRVVIQSGSGTTDNSISLYDSSDNKNISIASSSTALMVLQAFTSGQLISLSNDPGVQQTATLLDATINKTDSSGNCVVLTNNGTGDCLQLYPTRTGKGLYISSTYDSSTSPSIDVSSDSYGFGEKIVKTLTSSSHASNEMGAFYIAHLVGASTYRSESSTFRIYNENGGHAILAENSFSTSTKSTIKALGANPATTILELLPTNFTSAGGGSYAVIMSFNGIKIFYGNLDPSTRLTTGVSTGDMCITTSGMYRYNSGTGWNFMA